MNGGCKKRRVNEVSWLVKGRLSSVKKSVWVIVRIESCSLSKQATEISNEDGQVRKYKMRNAFRA